MACVGVRKGVGHVPAIEMMGSVAGKLVKNALHDCQGWLGWALVLRVAQFEAQAQFFAPARWVHSTHGGYAYVSGALGAACSYFYLGDQARMKGRWVLWAMRV